MKQVLFAPELRNLLAANDLITLRNLCEQTHPETVAELLSGLKTSEVWKVLHALDAGLRADVFSHFEMDQQVELASGQNRRNMAQLLEEMPTDDRADLVQRLDPEVREEILHLVARAEREDIRRLVSYEEGTAGAVMSTDYAALKPEVGVAQAIEQLRIQAPGKETIYYIYVVDEARHLIGFVSLKDLILSGPNRTVGEIMHTDVISASVAEDQEEVAGKIEKYDLIAIPVVDSNNLLVGIVTHDDAMDILRQEQTEDIEKFMAIRGAHHAYEYMRSSPAQHYSRRIVWLLALTILGTVSGLIVHGFAEALQGLILLAFYMPMVADMGGNTGSQAATLVIRAMALREVGPRDIFRIILKELRVALMLGASIAGAVLCIVPLVSGVLVPALTGDNFAGALGGHSIFNVAVAIAVALGIQVVSATLIGAMLPLAAARMKLDPAVVASPAITTVVDITGLLVYFGTAKVLLGI